VVEWHIREPHVERRLAAAAGLSMRDSSVASAPVVNPSAPGGRWLRPGAANLTLDERRLLVEIPTEFTDLQREDAPLALDWRLATRTIFQTYFGRGYRAVDFFLSREARRGQYLLSCRPDL
jgi:predicted GNAT superfamily acetyltransferase